MRIRTALMTVVIFLTLALGGSAHARHHGKSSDPKPADPAPPSSTTTTTTTTTTPAPAPVAAPEPAPAPPPPAPAPTPRADIEASGTGAAAAATTTTTTTTTSAAITIDDGECSLPIHVSAVDPIRSGVIPGALPEFAPPQLDVLGGSLTLNANGLGVDAVVAPAAIGTTSYIPVISDLRVGFYGRDNFQRLGGSLVVGWDSGSGKLSDDKADRTAGPCTPGQGKQRALWAARFERAYHNRIVIGARGAAELLPVVSGPRVIDPGTMVPVDVQAERFGGYAGTVHVGYWANRHFGLWAVGGVAGTRAIHGVRGVNMRAGGGIDLAYQLAVGQLRSDGFQPGFTFGAFGRFGACLTAGGCDQDVHGYDAPVAFDKLISAGAYIDVRLSNLLQLRLAVPTNYYVLKSAPAGSPGGANITEVIPTIGLNFASWGL